MKFLKSLAVVGLVVVTACLASARCSVWLLGPSRHQGPLVDRDVQMPALQAVDNYLRQHSRYHEGLQDGMKRYNQKVVSIVTWSDGDVNVFVANEGPQLLDADALPWPPPGIWTPVFYGPRFFQAPHPTLMFALHRAHDRIVVVSVAQADPKEPVIYTDEGVIVRIDILRTGLPDSEPKAPPKSPLDDLGTGRPVSFSRS